MDCRMTMMNGEWFNGHVDPNIVDVNPTLFRLVQIRVGWPLGCLAYERTLILQDARGTIEWVMDEPESPWRGGLAVPDWTPELSAPVNEAAFIRRIPIRPIWSGLLVNSALHAGLLGAGVWGAGRLARWRRRARGLCLRCGYDVRGLGRCPECGEGCLNAS